MSESIKDAEACTERVCSELLEWDEYTIDDIKIMTKKDYIAGARALIKIARETSHDTEDPEPYWIEILESIIEEN